MQCNTKLISWSLTLPCNKHLSGIYNLYLNWVCYGNTRHMSEYKQLLTFYVRDYVIIAMKAVHWLLIHPIVHNEGTPLPFPTLHPGPCSSVGMWQWRDRQTHVTNIHFVSATPHAKCNNVMWYIKLKTYTARMIAVHWLLHNTTHFIMKYSELLSMFQQRTAQHPTPPMFWAGIRRLWQVRLHAIIN